MILFALLTLFLLFVLFTILAVLSKKFGSSSVSPVASTYVAHPALLSPAERSFFGVLSQATQNNYQVFAKVRLADLIKPQNTPNRSQWQTAFNRISSKHVDFVICNSADLSIVAVVELDDSSHARSDRKERDTFIDSALSSARIPILHVRASQSYSPHQLRTDIQNAIDRKPTI
jgi:hypothetical protein